MTKSDRGGLEKKYRVRDFSRSTQDSNLEPPDDNNGTEIIVFRSQVRYPITPADPFDDGHSK